MRAALILLALVLGVPATPAPAESVPLAVVSARAAGLSRDGGVLRLDGVPVTGRLVAQSDDGGRSETDYVAGRRHGIERAWYADGARREVRTYRHGRKEGTHRGWWPDGTPRFLYTLAADRHEGQALEWYADGTLARDAHYRDGQEAGRQRMWTPSGALRANYVVSDGRRYGLIGTKPCSTP